MKQQPKTSLLNNRFTFAKWLKKIWYLSYIWIGKLQTGIFCWETLCMTEKTKNFSTVTRTDKPSNQPEQNGAGPTGQAQPSRGSIWGIVACTNKKVYEVFVLTILRGFVSPRNLAAMRRHSDLSTIFQSNPAGAMAPLTNFARLTKIWSLIFLLTLFLPLLL